MGYPMKELQTASLYITISIPPWLRCPSQARRHYPPALPEGFDPISYETSCAEGFGREEFDWGLYWHHGDRDGVWYTLQKLDPPIFGPDATMEEMAAAYIPSYKLCREKITSPSPRLVHGLVGLVRVLAVPPGSFIANTDGKDDEDQSNHQIQGDDYLSLPQFLDWLTEHMAPRANRSMVWATSIYLRCLSHISGAATAPPDNITPSFNLLGFLREALEFAYPEVFYSCQLPRPVLASGYGVELTRIWFDHEPQAQPDPPLHPPEVMLAAGRQPEQTNGVLNHERIARQVAQLATRQAAQIQAQTFANAQMQQPMLPPDPQQMLQTFQANGYQLGDPPAPEVAPQPEVDPQQLLQTIQALPPGIHVPDHYWRQYGQY